MIYLAAFLLLLLGLYVLMLRGRSGHPGLTALRGHSYAHRGLHGDSVPENSLTAFRRAFDHGYGIELDLHLLKDGTIAVMHDSNMERTTGKNQILEELTREDLSRFRLGGTQEPVPLFSQVLSLCGGRFPMIIELKTYHGNGDAVSEAACRMLEDYSGPYCLESFDPKCVRWLKTHHPDLIRGQLSENFLKNDKSRIPAILRFAASYHLESFLTRPDFIAHRFSDRKTLSNFLIRKLWRIQGVSWTIRNRQEFDIAVKEGWIPIFEGFLPPADPSLPKL